MTGENWEEKYNQLRKNVYETVKNLKQKIQLSESKCTILEDQIQQLRGRLSQVSALDEISLRIEGILIEQKNLREKLKSFKRGKEYQDLGEPTFNELLIRES